jgi:hypothetical protein
MLQPPRCPLVDIKQLSPASRRPAAAVAAADYSRPSSGQLLPPMGTRDNVHNHECVNPKSYENKNVAEHPAAINISLAAGGRSMDNTQSRSPGATVVSQQSYVGNGDSLAAPSPPATKIVFLSKEGNILAVSHTTAAYPPLWQRSRVETGQRRPPLEAGSSVGSDFVEDELLGQELASRLDLWRSLNGSPTYPLPPYEPLHMTGKTGAADKPRINGLMANGGVKLGAAGTAMAARIPAAAAGKMAMFYSSRQSTEESLLPGEDTDLPPGLRAGPSGRSFGQPQPGGGRPRLARQTRVSDASR